MVFVPKNLTARSVQSYGKEEMKLQQKTLHEVCLDTGISRRTIQGYEKMGLVRPAGKNKYGHLLYGEAEQQRIQLIWFYQQLELSRKEIQELLNAPSDRKKEILKKQVAKLESKHLIQLKLIEKAKEHISTL